MNNNIIPDPTDTALSGSTHIDRPSWSDPTLDVIDETQHPDDHGIYYRSAPTDEWTVVHESDGHTHQAENPLRVTVTGFRHTVHPRYDWPDAILVEGDSDPGSLGVDTMRSETARRLAAALNQAADLLDGKSRPDLESQLYALRDELLDNAALEYVGAQLADRLTQLLTGGAQR